MSNKPRGSLREDLEALGFSATSLNKTPLQSLAEAVDDKDRDEAEIKYLRESIASLTQKVHQAYHGSHGPDADRGTWETCNRGICADAQHVLNPLRPRGV